MSQYEMGKYHWVLRKVGGRWALFGPFLDGARIPAGLKNRKWRRRLNTDNSELAAKILKIELLRRGQS